MDREQVKRLVDEVVESLLEGGPGSGRYPAGSGKNPTLDDNVGGGKKEFGAVQLNSWKKAGSEGRVWHRTNKRDLYFLGKKVNLQKQSYGFSGKVSSGGKEHEFDVITKKHGRNGASIETSPDGARAPRDLLKGGK